MRRPSGAGLPVLLAVRQGGLEETLSQAYRQAKANAGASGVDRVRFQDIESYGVDRWLAELRQELVKRLPSAPFGR